MRFLISLLVLAVSSFAGTANLYVSNFTGFPVAAQVSSGVTVIVPVGVTFGPLPFVFGGGEIVSNGDWNVRVTYLFSDFSDSYGQAVLSEGTHVRDGDDLYAGWNPDDGFNMVCHPRGALLRSDMVEYFLFGFVSYSLLQGAFLGVRLLKLLRRGGGSVGEV